MITGRGAHQNDGSNANATLIYSKTHDVPNACTRIPSETRLRTCAVPTPGGNHGGTGAQWAAVSGTGIKRTLPSILDYPANGRGPPPISRRRHESHQNFPDLRLYPRSVTLHLPRITQFSLIEFRWYFRPGRDQTSVRHSLELRKIAQASRYLQRTRIREDACLPRLCQTPSGGPNRVLITPRPSRGAAV